MNTDPVRSAEPPISSGSTGAKRLDRLLRGFPRGDRLGFLVLLLHERARALAECGWQFAGHAPFEFGGERRVRRLVRGEARVPFALERRTADTRVPFVVYRRGNREWRKGPAQCFAREGDFVLAERLSVREIGAGAIG